MVYIDNKKIITGGVFVAVIITIVMSITKILSFDVSHPQDIIISIHYIWMSLALLGAQMDVQYVVKNFNFLGKQIGRGFFSLFLGIMCISSEAFQLFAGIILCLVGACMCAYHFFSPMPNSKYITNASEEK